MRFIITNGDHAADALRAAFPDAEVLPWRDALVEGPVPALAEDAFAATRSLYLAQTFGRDYDFVHDDFTNRNETLRRWIESADEIELWFETDLHDQLQLMQIGDRIARAARRPRVSLREAAPPLPSHELAKLAVTEVTARDLDALRIMWDAVRAPTPEALVAQLEGSALPAARAALRRLLEELPGPDGFSRIERETLRAITAGARSPVDAFRAYIASEPLPFLGDAGFFQRLNALVFKFGLIDGLSQPLAWEATTNRFGPAVRQAVLALTPKGRDAFAGHHDITTERLFDRSVGGTHLTRQSVWRWDSQESALIPPA